jgi:phosphoserine phosphatase
MKTVVFDVCGTLYNSNTTVDFAVFFLHKMGLHRRALTFSLLRVKLVAFAAYRLFGFNLREKCIGALDSWSKELIERTAVEFVNSELERKKNFVIFSILEKYLSEGNVEIYLASASIDSVVKAIADSLGVKWASSSLAYDSFGKCRGELANDITGSKMDVLQSVFGISSVDSFYSDNVEDIPASYKAENFYFIRGGIFSLFRARRMRQYNRFLIIKGR